MALSEAKPRLLDMSGYQWTVLFAAWLGWGFDVFDGLLFNFVAPNCVPTLLGLELGSPEAKRATLQWSGLLNFKPVQFGSAIIVARIRAS